MRGGSDGASAQSCARAAVGGAALRGRRLCQFVRCATDNRAPARTRIAIRKIGLLLMSYHRLPPANALILPEHLLRCCAGGTPGVAKGREIAPAGAAPAMTASARLPNHLQRGWLAKLQSCLGLDSKKMPRPPKRTGLELNRARPLKSPVSPSAPTRNVAFGSAPCLSCALAPSSLDPFVLVQLLESPRLVPGAFFYYSVRIGGCSPKCILPTVASSGQSLERKGPAEAGPIGTNIIMPVHARRPTRPIGAAAPLGCALFTTLPKDETNVCLKNMSVRFT